MLALGGGAVVILPETGGAILGWREGGTDLLRHATAEAATGGDVRAAGCFPLLPYCNRIAHGKFRWDGRDHVLNRNMGDHPHAIHGVGWQRAWQVVRFAGDTVSLALHHDAAGASALAWPFPFDATLDYALRPDGLTIVLGLTNRHTGPAPAGIGIHPYFPRPADARLTFRATGIWHTDTTALPARHEPVPPSWDHATGRAVGGEPLDNAFTGWDGSARIDAGPSSLTISADPVFGTLQVYTPAGAGFFCVEPVSHAPDALNRADDAMSVLRPGQTLSGAIRLDRIPSP